MQKTFPLQPGEQQQASRMDGERRELLAEYGAIELRRKAIKKRLPVLEEEQRKLLRDAVARAGVEQFNSARIEGSSLVVDMPDLSPAPRVNGEADPAPAF